MHACSDRSNALSSRFTNLLIVLYTVLLRDTELEVVLEPMLIPTDVVELLEQPAFRAPQPHSQVRI